MAPTRMMQVRLMVLPASMNNSLLPKIVVLGSARLERWGVIHKFKVIKVKVVNVKSIFKFCGTLLENRIIDHIDMFTFWQVLQPKTEE